MNVLEAMRNRRSVRHYLPQKVKAEKLQAVLHAVQLTPTRHNDQNIRVIVVRDPALRQQIHKTAQTQPMVEEADTLLVFCGTDATDFIMPCGQYGYTADTFLAVGFALLEAAEQELDTCIVCAFSEDAVKQVLNIPPHVRVTAMVALGYGNDDSPRKTKKAVDELVSYDGF